MDLDFKSLYIKDNKGAIREWRIGCEDGVIVIEYGQLNGAMQRQTEDVPRGKAGRSLEEQIMSRIASRIHKRRDMGYSPNIEDANDRPVNSLGFKKPMLAQSIDKIKGCIDMESAFYQNKYDGNRVLIANRSGEIIAYTRNGKLITTIDHITDNISMPEGTIIDGEIYCHGESLQTIVSWVKRKQENTTRLHYHAYDVISNKPYSVRFAMLNDIDYGISAGIVPTSKVTSMSAVNELFDFSREQGYEGGILRWGYSGYEDGKRSKSLIKIKKWYDDEFIVVGIRESADGWAVLDCQLPNGKILGVSAPGTMLEKQLVLKHKENYLGRMVRVEYAQVTKDGIPFHPIATNWRDKEDG